MRQRIVQTLVSLCCVLVVGVGAACASDENDLHAALDRFTGEWKGQIQVRALDGFVLKTVSARRLYSWSGDEQQVETTLVDSAGDYVISSRHAVRLGRFEAVVSRPGLPSDKYTGSAESGAVVWTNDEGNRRDAREQISERKGFPVLETSSVEPIRGLGLSGLVRLVGEFRRSGETAGAVAAPVPQPPAETNDGMRVQLDAAVLRASEAAARVKELESGLAAARAEVERAFAGSASEREQLQQEVKRTETALAAANAEIARLAGQITSLNNAMQQVRANDEATAAQAAALSASQQRVATLETAAEVSGKRADQAVRELEAARTQLGVVLQEREAARADAAGREKELAKLVAELESLRKAASSVALAREQFERELAAAMASRDEAQRLAVRREADAAGLAAELAALREESRRTLQQTRANEEATAVQTAALSASQQRIVALETAAEESGKRADQVSRELEAARTRLGVVLQEREAAQADTAGREKELAKLVAELESLRAAAGSVAPAREQFERELAAAMASRDEAQRLAGRREADAAGLAAELAALREESRRTSAERDELLQRALPLQRDNELLVRSAEALKNTVAGLTHEINALQAKLAETEEQQAASARELAGMRARPVADAAAAEREAADARQRIAHLEADLEQRQRDNERLLAASSRLEQERDALEKRLAGLEAMNPVETPVVTTPQAQENGPSIAASVRDKLIGEVQQMERRVLVLESERNDAREQSVLLQRQVEEVRRLRDDTLVRFQGVVAELNAMREEKERLARANVSLQAEVRTAQQAARDTSGRGTAASAGSSGAAAAPTITSTGRTADMVVAGLQVIGVTRGETEDKAILDGRLYRNGDVIEPELGIVFDRIEDNALIFHDRRGREYRRRF